jgi:hypothetical protein
MPVLLELQRAFAESLLSGEDEAIGIHILDDSFSAPERLRIYRNTCRSTLIETLRMTYPAVDRLVGPAYFDMAAGRFVELNPARSGYLNEYGGGFADFLAQLHETGTLTYLPDVARFEWALSVAANAEDAHILGADALAAVSAEHHAALCFQPHPSVSFLELSYPADQIADAVLSGDDAAMREIDLSGGPVGLVVHRGQGGLETQRLEPRAYDFVLRLCGGEALGRLLEAAPAEAAALLAEQLAKGRLMAFRIAQ